jgi:hypothetical protein
MKKLILGIALVGFAVACKNTDNTAVSDPSTAAAPEGACATACDSAAPSAGCCAEKAATCDKSAKVCPVTGEKIEN